MSVERALSLVAAEDADEDGGWESDRDTAADSASVAFDSLGGFVVASSEVDSHPFDAVILSCASLDLGLGFPKFRSG